MDAQLKEKIRASMKQLLITRGWPDNMNHAQIIQSLPDMWNKLAAEGLLQPLVDRGFNYRQFVELALQSQARAQAMADMEAFFRGNK